MAFPTITIGMAVWRDYGGMWPTIQGLRINHAEDMEDIEFVVVDNWGCQRTEKFVKEWVNGFGTRARYFKDNGWHGTAAPRDTIFRASETDVTFCLDSHLVLWPGFLKRLKQFYRDNPNSMDLLSGPLVNDRLDTVYTHFKPIWDEKMFGTWGTDERGKFVDSEPFEIDMMGLGLFGCRTDAWLWFHPEFREFGGEEGYIHEKFRRAGRKCLCHPGLRWTHRFGRPPESQQSKHTTEGTFRNYLIGWDELGVDLTEIFQHFRLWIPIHKMKAIVHQNLHRFVDIEGMLGL